MIKFIALISLSAVALFATPADNAIALNMTLNDYEFAMSISGIIVGTFFSYSILRL